MPTAIALSGGGSRGDFQIGALEFLYERGIRAEILCGTSVGAINVAKLAEGEDYTNPNRGLMGLKNIWVGLRRNSDMWNEESWLTDPDMDQHLADALRGKSLSITGPRHHEAPSLFELIADVINDLAFLFGDGTAILKSMQVVLSRARALFNLDPIRARIKTSFDLAAVQRWANDGGRLRLAIVALDSGRLRYITETGALLERDGTPVLYGIPTECVPLAAQLSSLTGRADGIRSDLRSAGKELGSAAPGRKGSIGSGIKALRAELAKLTPQIAKTRAALEQCRESHAAPPFRLSDLADGIIASASIPGIFPPVHIAGEYYVDGGVREVMPLQVAGDLGATQIYAIHASSRALPPFTTPLQAGILEIVARSVTGIAIDEVDLSDRRTSPMVPTVHIEPMVDFHDIRVIDPGLIQIARDYGYMSAADAVAGLDREHARCQLATNIAALRVAIWRLENKRAGQADPTDLASEVSSGDETLQPEIDTDKASLLELIAERRALGGPVPLLIEYWAHRPERHPWAWAPDDFPALQLDGTLVQEGGGGKIYVIYGGAKFHVPSVADVNRLYNWFQVRQLWEGALAGFPTVPRDGTLVEEEGGTRYVIYGGAKFQVPNIDAFERLYTADRLRLLWAGALDVNGIASVPRNGTLVREESDAVYMIYKGAKFHVPNMDVLKQLSTVDRVGQLWNGALDAFPTEVWSALPKGAPGSAPAHPIGPIAVRPVR